MFGSLARYMVTRRTALGIPQGVLAARLGISRPSLSQYEAGARQVPPALLPVLADALETPLQSLLELSSPVDCVIPADRDRPTRMPPYDIKFSLQDVPTHLVSRATLSLAERDEMEHAFPRDRPEELTVAIQMMGTGGKLRMCAPLTVDCPLLVVKPFTEVYAGHLLHHAIFLKEGDRELLALPQVALIVPKQAREYRVDYLLLWRGIKVRLWTYLEIIGGSHADKTFSDERRVRGLPMRQIAFESYEVERPGFMARLLARLRDLETEKLKTPRPP